MAKCLNPCFSFQASGKLGALIYNLNGSCSSRKFIKRSSKYHTADYMKKLRERFFTIKKLKEKFLKIDFKTTDLLIAGIKIKP